MFFWCFAESWNFFRLGDSTERTHFFQKDLQNWFLYSIITKIITFQCITTYKSLAFLLVIFNGNWVSLTVRGTVTITSKGNDRNEPFWSLKTLNPPNICFILVLFWGLSGIRPCSWTCSRAQLPGWLHRGFGDQSKPKPQLLSSSPQ